MCHTMKKRPDIALPVVNVDDDDSLQQDEALAKIAMFLANTSEPKLLSEIDDEEIRLVAALSVVSETTDDIMLKNFLSYFLRLRVSKNRQGRKELLDIAKSAHDNQESKFAKLKNIIFGGPRM